MQADFLSPVEQDYLDSIRLLELVDGEKSKN